MISEPRDTLDGDGYALSRLYQKRIKQNMDLFTVVSDYHNRRGTGKTILSLRLAHAMDRTDEGITEDKITLSVPELLDAYVDQPKGAALVLDEAEAGTSKYEAGTATNKALRKLISMGRIEEKYVIANLPNSGEMDRDLKALADVWAIVKRRGAATAHILGWNPYEEHPAMRGTHQIEWDDIPVDTELREVYNAATREKRRMIRGEGQGSYVKAAEAEEKAEKAEQEAKTELRNEFICDLYHNQGLTQREIAELDTVDVSRSHIANIV